MGLDITIYRSKKHNVNLLGILHKRKAVAHFRKVNFLIPYFQYERNCSYLVITKDEIQELVSRCNEILLSTSTTNPNEDNLIKKFGSDNSWQSVAEKLLPTQEGCFFGNNEYNESYLEDVKKVYYLFREILNTTNWKKEIIEMWCSW